MSISQNLATSFVFIFTFPEWWQYFSLGICFECSIKNTYIKAAVIEHMAIWYKHIQTSAPSSQAGAYYLYGFPQTSLRVETDRIKSILDVCLDTELSFFPVKGLFTTACCPGTVKHRYSAFSRKDCRIMFLLCTNGVNLDPMPKVCQELHLA